MVMTISGFPKVSLDGGFRNFAFKNNAKFLKNTSRDTSRKPLNTTYKIDELKKKK